MNSLHIIASLTLALTVWLAGRYIAIRVARALIARNNRHAPRAVYCKDPVIRDEPELRIWK